MLGRGSLRLFLRFPMMETQVILKNTVTKKRFVFSFFFLFFFSFFLSSSFLPSFLPSFLLSFSLPFPYLFLTLPSLLFPFPFPLPPPSLLRRKWPLPRARTPMAPLSTISKREIEKGGERGGKGEKYFLDFFFGVGGEGGREGIKF